METHWFSNLPVGHRGKESSRWRPRSLSLCTENERSRIRGPLLRMKSGAFWLRWRRPGSHFKSRWGSPSDASTAEVFFPSKLKGLSRRLRRVFDSRMCDKIRVFPIALLSNCPQSSCVANAGS